jgi:hypothetical protein
MDNVQKLNNFINISIVTHFYILNYLMIMKNTVFWGVMSRSPVEVNRHFGGSYCLHFRVEE